MLRARGGPGNPLEEGDDASAAAAADPGIRHRAGADPGRHPEHRARPGTCLRCLCDFIRACISSLASAKTVAAGQRRVVDTTLFAASCDSRACACYIVSKWGLQGEKRKLLDTPVEMPGVSEADEIDGPGGRAGGTAAAPSPHGAARASTVAPPALDTVAMGMSPTVFLASA